MSQLSGFLLTCLLLGMINSVLAATNQNEIINLQLRWHHQFQFAGYYAALEKGFYQEEGLDVRLHAGEPNHQPVAEVLAGRAQYAEGNSEVLYQRLLGKPLVALAAIFQHSPSTILARKDSGIDDVHKLIGKTVMLMNSTDDADFITMFLNEGLSLSQLHIIPSSYDLDDLINGKVDAFNAYTTNEPYYLKERNIPYNIIDPINYRVDFYSDILFTTEEELNEHPKRVEAMRRATLKGWRYAMDHPDEIIDLLIKHYPIEKSRSHLEFEATEMRKLILPDLIEIGHMNPSRWEHMANTFVSVGMVANLNKFAGFVYDPTPKQLPTWAIYTFILAFSIILGISLLSSYLLKVNRRLANAKETLRKTNLILSKEIEERKAIESSLRNSEIRYYTLFENMLGGFAYCQLLYDNQQSNDFIFLEVNPGFDLVTSLKNVKGKKVSEVIPEVNVSNPELFVVLQRVVEGGSPEKCEIFLNSLELWFSLSIYSTGDHYFIVIFDDITERQQLQQKYEHMAHIDFLTGLANRRYFMELAEAAIGRINRYGGCLSLLMLDLDHFKNINDKYGHQMGDKVLQKMSEVCKATLRDVDVIGRLGGEEFAILLPETDGKEAYEVAERLRNLVSKAILSVDKNQKLSFTTSVGAVSLTENDIDLLTLLNRADQALYKAKAAGRNIVITYNDTLAEQLDTDSLDLNVGN